MQRLRTHWLALMGAILLLTLTVSAAFGAPPTGDDANRGQTISSFVHDVVFGEDGDEEGDENADQEEDTEEEDSGEEDLEEDTEEEDSGEEDLEEDTEDEDSEVARQVPGEFANHGECVSDAAHDTEGLEDSDSENKGEWVSLHARFICWGLEPPADEEEEETATDETGSDVDEDADELSAKEQAKADREAARAERRAARDAARAEREAAKAAQQSGEVTNAGNSNGNGRGGGNAHGRGGGKP